MDSRQLKVCATCFDLSVSLLRVLEMTVTLAPEIFLDWNRPSSELLLRRLAQVSSCVEKQHLEGHEDPSASLQMRGVLGAPVASAVVPTAAAEQVVLPKISTYQLLPSFATDPTS